METMTSTAINDLRGKVVRGEPYDLEDLKNAVSILIGERVAAANAAAPKAARQPAKKLDLDDLL